MSDAIAVVDRTCLSLVMYVYEALRSIYTPLLVGFQGEVQFVVTIGCDVWFGFDSF